MDFAKIRHPNNARKKIGATTANSTAAAPRRSDLDTGRVVLVSRNILVGILLEHGNFGAQLFACEE